MRFLFSRVIQQYTEITTQAYCTNCNIQFNCNTNMIPITGLHVLTVMMLGILGHWGRIHGLKPAQASCSLQSSFCCLLSFYTLC